MFASYGGESSPRPAIHSLSLTGINIPTQVSGHSQPVEFLTLICICLAWDVRHPYHYLRKWPCSFPGHDLCLSFLQFNPLPHLSLLTLTTTCISFGTVPITPFLGGEHSIYRHTTLVYLFPTDGSLRLPSPQAFHIVSNATVDAHIRTCGSRHLDFSLVGTSLRGGGC